MKSGAFDYVSKPFSEDEITIVVRRAIIQKRLQKENEQFHRELTIAYGLGRIIGHSRPMMDIYNTVAMVINSELFHLTAFIVSTIILFILRELAF